MTTEKQLIAIKDAYWDNLENENELDVIYDSLYNFVYPELNHEDFDKIIKNNDFIKKVFYSLPQHIIGNGIRWDFNDTEVRDDIYIHIKDNQDFYKQEFKK